MDQHLDQRGHRQEVRHPKKIRDLLDARAGIQWEGEQPPAPDGDDLKALAIFNLLSNGMGGLDWSGLDLLCEFYQVRDVEGLLLRLVELKTYTPPADDAA